MRTRRIYLLLNAKWRNGFADETQVEVGSFEMDRTSEQIKPPRSRCLVSKIKFTTTDKTTSTVAKTSGERPGPDRNSRRPRAFAGSVDSLNSIHRAPELRIIQLRVFSVPLSIHRRGDQTFAAPLHFRTMHYLALLCSITLVYLPCHLPKIIDNLMLYKNKLIKRYIYREIIENCEFKFLLCKDLKTIKSFQLNSA